MVISLHRLQPSSAQSAVAFRPVGSRLEQQCLVRIGPRVLKHRLQTDKGRECDSLALKAIPQPEAMLHRGNRPPPTSRRRKGRNGNSQLCLRLPTPWLLGLACRWRLWAMQATARQPTSKGTAYSQQEKHPPSIDALLQYQVPRARGL